MPPKTSVVAPAASLSPPPPATANDAQDLLIIQDIMDTLDQIPPELTRVYSDLNELGAVLYSTLIGLEKKLYTLINWIQDPTIQPEKRFELLQEIAEEAARYKLGGDDKIRVAGGACDGIMAHQKHISNLLAASTLLNPSPPSPYTQTLTLPFNAPVVPTRRLQRAANSPSRQIAAKEAAAALNEGRIGDTPTKKKKGRVGQLGNKDDDETSSQGGEKEKKKTKKRKQAANRALSPTESVASTSAFTGKTSEPRTARQLAAAASRARKAEQEDNSDEESKDEGPKRSGGVNMQITPSTDSMLERKDVGGLGLDVNGSREGSNSGGAAGKSNNATPSGNGAPKTARARAGVKRSRPDEEDEDESEAEDDEVIKPVPKRVGSGKKPVQPFIAKEVAYVDEADSKTYCTCGQVSYGEMIGCDDDDCDIEWYHLGCLNLDKTPEGNWICPRCVERRKKQPKTKKSGKSKVRK
ncbi:hypothetical protein I316_02036 [Kwoniella heveanensis BCC8398]|uniref:Chromatin modification-related protein n=1 Tax=Kwoniella heveanensis BCC8398 TaxID=1296120 RepID=A0A1B9GYQ9_9TREE|nr:hypothetical protein I316_02036 [Kwoniella heveanensis BCC8398]